MRLYHHISKFKFYRWNNKYDREMLQWACNLKAGDLVNGCTTWPFNTIVDHIEIYRMSVGRRGFIVTEVTAYTTDGRQHTLPGGGCLERPYTEKQIRENLAGYGISEKKYIDWLDEQIEFGWCNEEKKTKALERYHRAKNGLPVCDEKGMRLPQDQIDFDGAYNK